MITILIHTRVKKETTEEELSPEEYEIMLDVIEMYVNQK
jgi:hypothetical protein